MIGEGDGNKSQVEQTSIEFLNLCVGPWLNAWEQELKIKLFPIEKPATAAYFAKFDTRWLRYPDAASRATYYQTARSGGWLNANDIRELEDMNPITDGSGDVYWAPVNMIDAATGRLVGQSEDDLPPRAELPQGGTPQNKAQRDNLELASRLARYTRIFYGSFRDATGRILKRDVIDVARFTRCFKATLLALIESISTELANRESVSVIASTEFKIEDYLEEMRVRLQGVRPEHDETYALDETKRAIETWFETIAKRYQQ
jgi:hypothetical protein